jgi:hypothetical protein
MSQYYTITTITASTGTNKYVTVPLSAGTITTSTAITARRVLITNGASPVFLAFGSSPVTGVNVGFQIPANGEMIFNFKSGDKVAAVSAAASAISILDLD